VKVDFQFGSGLHMVK